MLTYTEFKDQIMNGEHDHEVIHNKYAEYFRENAQIGDGATVHYWTDKEAYTIIRRTPKTLTLRRCKAILSPDFKPDFIPGGFAGTVVNQHEQCYTYEEDENGRIVKAHWSEAKHGFYVDRCLFVSPGRHEFYDYNF